MEPVRSPFDDVDLGVEGFARRIGEPIREEVVWRLGKEQLVSYLKGNL